LKTCRQNIQVSWYNTQEISIITTTEDTEQFHEEMTEALNMFSQLCPQLDTVAQIHSRAVTWEDDNDMVSLRCGEDLVWLAVQKLSRWWLEKTERHIALWNCDLSDDKDEDDGNGYLTGGRQVQEAITGQGMEHFWPDQRADENNNPLKDDVTISAKCILVTGSLQECLRVCGV
jgi:hypothetical protein